MWRLKGIGSGRMRVLVALVIAGVGAATLGLSPVMAGKNDDPTRFSSAFEAGFVNHGLGHLSIRDVRNDKLRAARCAVPGYRAAYAWKCPALSPKLRLSEARQRALCTRSAYRTRHPRFCPRITAAKVDRALKHALEQQPASVTGRWDPNLVQIQGLAINSMLLPTGKILWYAYPQKPNFVPGYPGSNEAQVNADLNYAEAWVFDPATGASVERDPPINPATGKPYNLWCSGQVLLRDGRVLVAGGNKAYWTLANQKYQGLDAVLTFNPFNETWTVQPHMRDGRWYPTLTELSDGRVVITAGLNSAPIGGEQNNSDIEVFTPSADLNGVGTIQKVGDQSFGLYPHVFLNTQGKLITLGPDETDSHIIDPGNNFAITNTPALLSYSTFAAAYPGQVDDGDPVGRREWGSAVMLPSGPEGPSTVMMIGGSDAEASHYADPAQTNETLLVNMTNGSMVKGPSNIRPRSHVNTTILPDGSLFTNGGGAGSVGGDQYAGPVYTGELLNPGAGAWIETDPQQEARTYHSTSLLLPDGRVATMGDDRTLNSQNRALRKVEYYDPPYLYKGARPTIASAPAGTPYGVPVGIGTPDAIAKAVIIKLGATTHALDTSQRSLSLNFVAAPGGISVTMPSSANAAPPGYYQLFLVNAAGVPSVAKFIRLDTGLPAPSAIPVVTPPPGTAAFPAPKISKLKATVSFKKGFATVKLSFKASKAFTGSVKLFPIAKARKGSKAKLINKAIASKTIKGVGSKTFAATIRFSVKGKRFPLKLRMTIALKDKRGGATRTTTKGLLLIKSPKPTARILARAR